MSDRLVRWLPYALLCLALAWVARIAAAPINDPDAWWHLRLGNDLIDQRSLATPSHWSSFATVSWVPTEPLPEIASAFVERWFGLPGLAWLLGLCSMLVVISVHVANRREASLLPASVATVFAMLASSGVLTSRPQLVSFMLLPVVMSAWLRTEQDLAPRWWLIPLFWLWSLCHGFWFIGVAYGFVFVIGIALSRVADRRQIFRLALVAVGSLVVVLLNPVGPGVFTAPFAVHTASDHISEWYRTPLYRPEPLGVLTMVVATLVIWAVTRSGFTWARLFVLVGAVFWTWYAYRTVVVGGLTVAPIFAAALEALVARSVAERPEDRSRRKEAAVLGVWGAVLLGILALVVPRVADAPGGVPLTLDARLDSLPAGTAVFNNYEVGGWLTWRHPDLDQYVDGLATPYSAQHLADYFRADGVRSGWYDVVRSSHAPVALLKSDAELASGLETKGWVVSGSGNGYVLLLEPGYSLAPSS